MTYQQTINYLYAHLPMFSRVGTIAYKEDLHNTIALCNHIGNPQNSFKTIHIAGTNGKGSTSHMLAAILQQAGYKTGLYTSPHLKDFRERIKINGKMIPENVVIDFVKRTKNISITVEPSFFELTVAMAFDHFAQEKVDIAVIETGLGGRLDSTNIIHPILSVITNIGYDHMNILGNTITQIAVEKAGIIKQDVPVVIGEFLEETKNIFLNKAKACNAPVYFAENEISILHLQNNVYKLIIQTEETNSNHRDIYTLDLNGIYQAKNLRTVLCALKILKQLGFQITDDAIKYALAYTKKLTGLHGRWDVIAENPTTVLDVAHNEDGIRQLMEQVRSLNLKNRQVHFIIGMVKDKEVSKVLSLLPKDANYCFTNAHVPRALPAQELMEKAIEHGFSGPCFDEVNNAIQYSREKASPDELIIICGSVFLVGEVDY